MVYALAVYLQFSGKNAFMHEQITKLFEGRKYLYEYTPFECCKPVNFNCVTYRPTPGKLYQWLLSWRLGETACITNIGKTATEAKCRWTAR